MAKKMSNKLPVAKAGGPVSTADRPAPYKPSKQELDRERRYRAEDALRDIERAEGHKRDSKLMGDVKQLAQEKMSSLKKIC